jgi:hypothetical protein
MSIRISTCKNDFGCLLNPFYSTNRITDIYQSSSGIDINPYEFNKYENFNLYKNYPYKNHKLRNYNKNLILIIIIILIIIFFYI